MLKPRNIEVIEIISPALNTDLDGRGVHDKMPPVSDFANAVFPQPKDGKMEITFGFSDVGAKATPDEIKSSLRKNESINSGNKTSGR